MTPIRLRVRELRDALGWSQTELATHAGIRQATVSKVEAGGTINLATLEKLADALGVNASALIVHEQAPKRGKGK